MRRIKLIVAAILLFSISGINYAQGENKTTQKKEYPYEIRATKLPLSFFHIMKVEPTKVDSTKVNLR